MEFSPATELGEKEL